MRNEQLPTLETFLVEDVILTLGNLRGSLVWLGKTDANTKPEVHRAGLARLDRQIATLEERAWAVCHEMRDGRLPVIEIPAEAAEAPPRPGAESAPAAPLGPSLLPMPEHPSISLESLLRDALSGDAPLGLYEGPPTFRSSRRARR